MNATMKKVIIATVLMMGTTLLLSCGGGSSSDTTTPAAPAAVDLTGTWQVEQVINGNCSGTDYPYTEIHVYTGTQNGNTLTMRDTMDGTEYKGTVSGYALKVNWTVPDGDGTLTNNSSCTCAADGHSFTGSGTWTYKESGYSCSGTVQVTGTQLVAVQVDATGTWNGNYASDNYGISGTFSATIVDTNGQLTGTISVPFISMVDAELVGTVDGNAITFGDIDNRITFTGVVKASGTASGTYEYDALGDEGTWTAHRQ